MAETPITFRLPSGALVTCTPAVAAAVRRQQSNPPTVVLPPTGGTGDVSTVNFAQLFREGLHNG